MIPCDVLKFKFTLQEDKGLEGKVYVTDVIQRDIISVTNEDLPHLWGTYTTRFRGPNTAFTSFIIQYRWDPDPMEWFGFKMNRYFEGHNSGLSCRRWLNTLLLHPPSNILPLRGGANAPDLVPLNLFEALLKGVIHG